MVAGGNQGEEENKQGHEEEEESRKRQREEEPAAAEPVHALSAGKKPKQTAAGIIAGKAKSGAKA